MVYNWLTCEHTAEYTRQAQVGVTMFLFPIFGYIGLRGVMGRDQLEIEMFSWFYLFVGVLNILVLAADGYYTHVCGHLPDWPLSVLYGLYPEKMNQLYRLGHDPAQASPRDLQRVVGLDSLTMVFLFSLIVIAYNLYMAVQVSGLAKAAAGGPCGLGPMYGLEVGGDLAREFNHCVNDLMDSMKVGEDGGLTLPISNLHRASNLVPIKETLHSVDCEATQVNGYAGPQGYGTMVPYPEYGTHPWVVRQPKFPGL
jgi:hypothetical protein